MFTIGGLSRASGETIKTLRYWSNLGLLTHTTSESQYRQYTEKALEEVRFIRSAQRLGWTLKDIKRLFQQGCSGASPCSHVMEDVQQQVVQLERQIQHLQNLKQQLQHRLDWATGQSALDCQSACCVVLLPLS